MTNVQMSKRLEQGFAPLKRKCARLAQRYARVDSGKNGEAYLAAMLEYQSVLENLNVALKAIMNPRTRGSKAKSLNRLDSFRALPIELQNYCSEAQRLKLIESARRSTVRPTGARARGAKGICGAQLPPA